MMEQKAAAIAVAKKLSSLRATLDDEEQMVLDSMIEGAYSVRAHGMVHREIPRETPASFGKDDAAAHAMTTRATPAEVPGEFPGEDEVAAHIMAAGATPAEVPGEFPGEDEAAAHIMAAGATPAEVPGEFPGEDEAAAHALDIFQITYDETKEAYIVAT
jgi:hypothetical protein